MTALDLTAVLHPITDDENEPTGSARLADGGVYAWILASSFDVPVHLLTIRTDGDGTPPYFEMEAWGSRDPETGERPKLDLPIPKSPPLTTPVIALLGLAAFTTTFAGQGDGLGVAIPSHLVEDLKPVLASMVKAHILPDGLTVRTVH